MRARDQSERTRPRLLSTFNDPIEDWLDFFCFATYTDRDGKYQLGSLAESAFTPLSRTTRFMLTEEAHHLFVGETGIARILRRTAQLMKENQSEDVTPFGGIPLEIVQKYINYWYSVSLDLFGSEDSSNAANYFAHGLKGRFNEANRKVYPDPTAREGAYSLSRFDKDSNDVRTEEIPMRRAMNAVLRDAYIDDCKKAIKRWAKILQQEGCSDEIKLPSGRFHRTVGAFSGCNFDPDGKQLTEEQWKSEHDQWLPTEEDRAYVKSVQVLVTEQGKYANWISPPTRGIHGKPLDFEYVRI